MFQDQYKKLEPEEVKTVLENVNPKLEAGSFDSVETTILAINLPFYKDHQFLDISDYSINPPGRAFVVYNPKTQNVTILDWSNEPIYALNKDLPITLDEKNIETYIKFFFTHVRGDHGRFIVVENIDDIPWKEDPPPAARRAIGKMLFPVTFQEKKDSAYLVKACMLFRDSLFKTDIYVEEDGRARMTGEELLIEDMPVLDDMFGQ